MISQKQQLKQQQKLLPQQIMLMKLLQTPAIALEQTIKDEIEKNPMLEEVVGQEDNDTPFEDNDDTQDNADDFDLRDYIDEDEDSDHKLKSNNGSNPNEDVKSFYQAAENTLQDMLIEQLGWQNLSETEYIIGHEIIGNLDDSGYLSRSIKALSNDLILQHNLFIPESEIQGVLSIVQSFDPPGIGAQDLQECLLLQLRRKNPKTPEIETAIRIVEKTFEACTKKHYDKICQRLGISEHELKLALDEIVKLDPKPSGNVPVRIDKNNQYITPDFYLFNNNGKIEFYLNNSYTPNLQINKYYSDLLQGIAESKTKTKKERETLQFIKDRIDSAKWFIEAVNQRENTLEKTLSAIIEYQHDFFLDGDINKLRPMRLKDVADKTGYDISTISRVANQKYVQTHFGTFLLKDFFSKSFTDSEGNDVATDTIKKILVDCVASEDKANPMTDEALTEVLNKKGFPVARRTVAKYRESLKIPVGRLRKKIQE